MYIAMAATYRRGVVVSLHQDYEGAKRWIAAQEADCTYLHSVEIGDGHEFSPPWKFHSAVCRAEG
jgi:hypothetical protein